MKRRDLFKKSFLYSSGLWLSSFSMLDQAFAQQTINSEEDPNFLVLLIIDGGWTTNLSLDPWIKPRLDEKEIFLDYREDEILKQGDLFLGPAMASLKGYASRMSIINGIFMSATDNGHPASQIYITSGKGSGLSGNISAEFELASIKSSPAGVLYNIDLYSGEKSVNAMSLNELSTLTSEPEPDQPFVNPQSPISQSFQFKKQNLGRIQDMQKNIASLKEQGKSVNDGHQMAAAFRAGLSRSTTYRAFSQVGNMDTHGDHPNNHRLAQTNCWEKIKTIFDGFKDVEFQNGRSMFDVTTFMVTSEFSRTPALDASKGTNHNPMNNSVLLIGPNFKPGTTFGESRLVTAAESANSAPYLIGQMVDLQTGEVIRNQEAARKNGSLIKPETVIATLADALKIQRNIFTPVGMNEKSIKQILKG